MKLSTIFSLMFGVWCIDFFITIIMINYLSGFEEANPIAVGFFNQGIIGYVFFFFSVAIFVFLLSWFIKVISQFRNNKYANVIQWIAVIVFLMLNIYVIIHNLLLI